MSTSTTIQSSEFTIREATIADLDIVMHHRRSMFSDMGYADESALNAMLSTSRPFFAERMADGGYRAWLVENSFHQVIAGGGLIIFDYHSSPTDPFPKRPVIVNMYTERPYRRKGIARMLMRTMIAWCREEGFGSVGLHASNEGRPLYEELGFKPTNEMRLMLR
jgi:GNAT superfamily N-acetyltransferase